MSIDHNELISRFEEESDEDYIGLWEVIIAVKEAYKLNDDHQIRTATLELLHKMLVSGFEAGNPSRTGSEFLRWQDQDPDFVIKRIDAEWRALGREPNIGDIVWFDRNVT